MKYAPPWREPYFIGVAGCSGSGKTAITSSLIQRLNTPWTVLLSMDNFYRPLTADQRQEAFASNFDFDAPDAVDFDMMVDVLHSIKRGEKTQVPVYSFKEHDRTPQTITLYGANVVFIEGIYALYDPRILELLDLKVFVHEDYDVCMARRLHRDILYRGRQLDLSIQQWQRFVKPNYLAHILPTQQRADIVLPRGLENKVALDMLHQHVKRQLQIKSTAHLAYLHRLGHNSDSIPFSNVAILPKTNQVNALFTLIADVDCPRERFVHAFNRVAAMLCTQALEVLFSTSDEKVVNTPLGAEVRGPNLDFESICGVTMIRGGEIFETVLKASIPTIYLGRLLIQSDNSTGEPKLHLSRLPPKLSQRAYRVILTEAQLISGAAAVMAIAVLVDHGVSENDVVVVAYSASDISLRRITAAYPGVHVVVGRVDSPITPLSLDKRYYGV